MRLLVLSLGLVLGAFAQRSAPASNCAADGSVVNSITGEPIPRATLQFLGQTQVSTVADSGGRWRIAGITCGRVTVFATKTGFLSAAAGRLRAVSDAVASPDSPAHDVRVEMTPQSVITGKVVDEAGDPLQNAQILVMTSRVLEGLRVFVQNSGTTTNDLGEFRASGLAAGKVIVCARGPMDARLALTDSAVLGESCYPGPVEGGSANAMSLAAGREARVDFTLSHVPAMRIRGKVTGMPEGGGAMVSLVPRGTVRNAAQGRQANMQRDGSFELRGVPPGAWMLSVDYWEAGARLFARVPVDVGGADIDGVAVHLEAGFTVKGTVRVESATGKSPNPQQINLSLRAADVTGGMGSVQWDQGRTTFTIRDVTPGTYSLAGVNLQAPFYLKSAMMGGRDLAREAVPIGAGAGQIEVTIADDGGSVRGRMEDANGDAVGGWVTILKDGRAVATLHVSADGSFQAQGLSPGDYRVFGWDDSENVEWADAEWMRRFGGSGAPVSVGAGQTADVKVVRVTVPRD